jgi:hypothetical protein
VPDVEGVAGYYEEFGLTPSEPSADGLDGYRDAGVGNPMITHIRGTDFAATLVHVLDSYTSGPVPACLALGPRVRDSGGSQRGRGSDVARSPAATIGVGRAPS